MKSNAEREKELIGTPGDYSENLYRFYLELADCSADTRRLLEDFLPQYHALRITDLDQGYEFAMPIQSAPDLVRHLLDRNIAVYQLIRLARAKGQWHRE